MAENKVEAREEKKEAKVAAGNATNGTNATAKPVPYGPRDQTAHEKVTDIYGHAYDSITKNGWDYTSPWKSKNPYQSPKNDTYIGKSKKFCKAVGANGTGNATAGAAPAEGAAPAAPAAPAEGAAPAAPAGGNATNGTNATAGADDKDCIPVPAGNATNASGNATADAAPAEGAAAADAEAAALLSKKSTFKSNLTAKNASKNVPIATT